MPYYNKGSERLETSVFCVEDLTHDDVKSLSLAARSDNSAKAVAHHQASDIHESSLVLKINNEPERHANIVSWPNEKFEQLNLAEKLSSNARLEIYTTK